LSKSSDPVVAEVGKAVLTLSQLNQMMTGITKPDSVERLEVISQWVNEEILYQEALRRELYREPATAELIATARRKILTDRISDEIHGKSLEPSLAELKAFHEKIAGRFLSDKPIWQFDLLEIPTKQPTHAQKAHGEISKSDFDKVKQVWSQLYKQKKYTKDWVPRDSIPQCVWSDLHKLEPGETSASRQCKDNYAILHVKAFRDSATVLSFDEVEGTVRELYKLEAKKQKIRRYTDNLKAGKAVFTYLENLPNLKPGTTEQ
jgi:hypothetical protein